MKETILSDEFLKDLPGDPWEAARSVISEYDNFSKLHKGVVFQDSLVIDTLAFLRLFFQHHPELNQSSVTIPNNRNDRITILVEHMNHLRSTLEQHVVDVLLSESHERYAGALAKDVVYTFSDDDFSRLQELLNQLRDLISNHPVIQPEHKRRLLRRLESLQSELHKTISNLDRFWGLIGEAGIVIGKFGTDAKPIVDRIREIAQIIWVTQATAHSLPAGPMPPLLPGPSDIKTI